MSQLNLSSRGGKEEFNNQTNNFFSKNKKGIIIIIAVIAVLFVAGQILKRTNKKEVAQLPSPEKKEIAKPDSFSRVTFFHTQAVKGSLAMPETWEGRYRVVDGGNTVTFMYIVNPEKISPLFSIRNMKKSDWEVEANKNGSLINETDGYVFIYEQAKENPYTDSNKEGFTEMQKQADEIVKSFKAFKL